MAKDDFHVLAYKLLTYLYDTLKAGEAVDPQRIMHDTITDFAIPYPYWVWLLSELKEAGYISGFTFDTDRGTGNKRVLHLEKIRIRFAGVEYLTDNTFMEKVRNEQE